MRQIGLKIATLGDAGASPSGATGALSRCYRFVKGRAPGFDAAGLYRGAVLDLPSETNFDVDFQAGRAATGALNVTLRHTAELAGLFLRPRIRRVGVALSGLASAAATSFSASTNPGAGAVLLWARECLRVSAVTGSGPYTLTVARGQLGTTAVAHGIGPGVDVELFNAAHGPFLTGVRCELFSYDPGAADYSTESTEWAGVVEGRDSAQSGVINLRLESLLGLIGDTNVFRNTFIGTLEAENETGWTYKGPVRQRVRASLDAAGEYGLFRVGDCAAYGQIYNYGSGDDAVTRVVFWRGEADSRTNTVYGAMPDSPPEIVHELYYVGPGATATADPPDANSLPFSNNVITLALQLLTATNTALNGPVDVGSANLGAGIDAALIDTAAFQRVALELAPLARVQGLYLNPTPDPVRLRDLLTGLLRPLNCVVAQGADNLLTLLRLDVSAEPSHVVPDYSLVKQGGLTFQAEGTARIDNISVEYGGGLSASNRHVIELIDGYNRARIPGAYLGTETLKLHWISDIVRARVAGEGWLSAWHFPYPRVDFTLPRDRFNVHLGQIIELTCTEFPGDDGPWPLVSGRGIVVQRRVNHARGLVRVGLLLTGYQIQGASPWAPSAVVSSWGSPVATVQANAFTGPEGRFATDAAAWAYALTLGACPVDILDADLSPRGSATLTATGANSLTLTAPTVTPAPGDVIVLRTYGNAGAVQPRFWSFLADANETLGASNAPANEWGP